MALYKAEPCAYCQRRLDDTDDAPSAYALCDLAGGKQCKPCKQAFELDKEITRTRIMLDALLSQKQKLHVEINQSHDRMIQQFPAEILSYIFLHSISEEEEVASTQSVTTPFILGGVCQAWRKVAWASPNLWTHINIFVKPGYNLDTLEIAHEWLLRSGELPISVCLVSSLTYDGSGGPIEKFRSKLAGLMQRYISRCWNLRFLCHQQFMPSFSGVAPILEKLELSSAYEAPPAVSIYLISLRTLRSEGIRLCLSGYRLVSLDIDLGSITTFEGSISANDFSQILQRASRLRSCNLTGLPTYTSFAGEQYSFSRTITPQSITSLSLKRSSEDKHPTAMLLTMLTIPTLTHLTMGEVGTHHLERFIQRSGCSFVFLSLDRIDCPEDTDLSSGIFGAIPTLEELHINADNPCMYEFFTRLASTCVPEKDNKVVLLPCLRVLDIWFSVEMGFSWRHVVSILGSPSDLFNPMRRPITHFCVTYDWHLNKSAVRPINISGVISPSHLLQEDITRSFLLIAESGVDLELYDVHRGCDLLQENMDYHSIPIPAWYKTTAWPSTYHTTSRYSEMDAINALDSQFDLEYSDEDPSDSEDLEDDNEDDGGSDTDISDSSYNYANGLPDRITGESSELLSDS